MRKEKCCGAIVYKYDGDYKFLVVKHKEGHVGFPKGHVEENESEKETATREVLEETNILADIDTSFRMTENYIINNEIDKEVVYFIGKYVNGDIKNQEAEISKCNFCTYQEVLNSLTFKEARDIFTCAYKYIIDNNLR